VLRRDRFVKEMRKQCCYLHDHESFIEKLLKPLNDFIPHDAQAVTGIDAETYNPRYIYYGHPAKFLNDITNIKIEDVRGMKRSFELGMKDGYNTSTTESFGLDFRDDAAYKVIFEPYGFRHGMQTYFFSEAGAFLGLIGLTKKSSPGFTDEEIELLEQVGPYVLHAFRKYRWLVNMEFFNRPSLEDMVFAALITNRSGKVLWSNALAENNIPELVSSGKLPEELKPCLKKVTGFFQKGHDPFIYREVETSTPYGSAVCFAVDENSSKYLPVNEEGVLFVIDSDRLNRAVINSLTAREKEVLKLIVRGKFDKEIAHDLGISSKTVMGHAGRLFKKLNVSNRAEAAVKAVKLGLE
jgi:DNA-binding CsgD family transcriptional regulator